MTCVYDNSGSFHIEVSIAVRQSSAEQTSSAPWGYLAEIPRDCLGIKTEMKESSAGKICFVLFFFKSLLESNSNKRQRVMSH